MNGNADSMYESRERALVHCEFSRTKTVEYRVSDIS